MYFIEKLTNAILTKIHQKTSLKFIKTIIFFINIDENIKRSK